MGRKRRRNVPGKKMMKVDECYDDGHSAEPSSDGDNGNEESAGNMGNNIENQTSEETSARNGFYEKLIKLNESSGLSLVFNFRETKLDLYLVYKEVTERGGSHEVSRAGKWNEVASAASTKNHGSILPSQIQKVYENLLYQYEQIHCYRTQPSKLSGIQAAVTAGKGCSSDCSVGKRNCCHRSFEDEQAMQVKFTFQNCQVSRGPGRPRKRPALPIIRDPNCPTKPRTAHQLFLKMECERLREIHGVTSGNLNLRNMANQAWKHLSKNDRLPYVEASQKDKERFEREMAAYYQNKNKQLTMTGQGLGGSTSTSNNIGASPRINDDYYVPSEVGAGNLPPPDEPLAESSIQILKNAGPDDPIFQMNWDGSCGSPDSIS